MVYYLDVGLQEYYLDFLLLLFFVLKAVYVSSDASDTESKKLLVLGSVTVSWCSSFWCVACEVT